VDSHKGGVSVTAAKERGSMKMYIALFRGINVGGKNRLPMKDLRSLLADLGAQSVQTYIQSGNAVFRHETENAPRLSDSIAAAIKQSHGFDPRVLLLDLGVMEQAIASNPYPEAEAEPKSLHLYFLASVPQNPDLETLDSIKQDDERFKLIDQVFYLHAPAGIGRSKLAARVEQALGVAVTARNWRTACKITAMARQGADSVDSRSQAK
jgi:uncharacterized protein (DUF1697 family)